jgi:hypothetical protein
MIFRVASPIRRLQISNGVIFKCLELRAASNSTPHRAYDRHVGMRTFASLLGTLNRSRARRGLYRTRRQYFDIALDFSRWRVNLARTLCLKNGLKAKECENRSTMSCLAPALPLPADKPDNCACAHSILIGRSGTAHAGGGSQGIRAASVQLPAAWATIARRQLDRFVNPLRIFFVEGWSLRIDMEGDVKGREFNSHVLNRYRQRQPHLHP